MKTEQPLWGRGQMVSPQHFQQQVAYAAWSAECIARLGLSHPWGMIDATFEPDALKLCRLQARQTAPLMQQVRGALTRLENALLQDGPPPAIVLPSQALASTSAEEVSLPVSRLVYVIRPEPEVNVEVIHETLLPPKRWPAFIAGMCSALVMGATALWGWHYVHRVDEVSQALTASVTALPQVLSPEKIRTLRQAEGAKPDPASWLKRADSQLNTFATLPAGWAFQYGNSLLNQAQTLWPDRPEVAEMRKQWQQRLAVNVLSSDSLTGWYDGMQQLQQLTERLNALDGQKGKYITVSELKSQIFAMQQAFGRTVPVEEQLRLLQLKPPGDAALIQQTGLHINQLEATYSTLVRHLH